MLSTHYNPVSAQDYIPRSLLKQVQLQRLQRIVAHEYNNVEFYRRRMDEKGVKPADIHSLSDISKLPFMMKKDLRDTYPFGLFALDMKQVVRLHASSGTSRTPTATVCSPADSARTTAWKLSAQPLFLLPEAIRNARSC